MAEQPIPAEMLDAAIQAINNERAILGAGNMKSETFATLALEAANVPALLAERDALRERVAELEAAAEHFRSCRECAESFPCDEGEAHARAMEAIND